MAECNNCVTQILLRLITKQVGISCNCCSELHDHCAMGESQNSSVGAARLVMQIAVLHVGYYFVSSINGTIWKHCSFNSETCA